MTYATGVYTPPTGSNPNAHVTRFFFRDVIRPALLATGYTVVEEFVSPDTRSRLAVFATPAGAPAAQVVFAFGNETGTSYQQVMSMTYLAKPYNATSKTFSGMAGSDYSTYSYDAAGYNITFDGLPADGMLNTGHAAYTSNTNPGGFEYWVSITARRIVISTRVSTNDTAMIVCAVEGPTAPSRHANGAQWARTSINYDQMWGMPGEPGITTAGAASIFGVTFANTLAVKDAYSPTRILTPTQLRARGQSELRGFLEDMPMALGANLANGDTLTDANGKVRVLIRSHSSSANFYAIDTENV